MTDQKSRISVNNTVLRGAASPAPAKPAEQAKQKLQQSAPVVIPRKTPATPPADTGLIPIFTGDNEPTIELATADPVLSGEQNASRPARATADQKKQAIAKWLRKEFGVDDVGVGYRSAEKTGSTGDYIINVPPREARAETADSEAREGFSITSRFGKLGFKPDLVKGYKREYEWQKMSVPADTLLQALLADGRPNAAKIIKSTSHLTNAVRNMALDLGDGSITDFPRQGFENATVRPGPNNTVIIDQIAMDADPEKLFGNISVKEIKSQGSGRQTIIIPEDHMDVIYAQSAKSSDQRTR